MSLGLWLSGLFGLGLGVGIFLAPFEKMSSKYWVMWAGWWQKIKGDSETSLKHGRKLLFMFSELELCSEADVARLENVVRQLPPYKMFHVMAQSMAQTFRQLGCGLQDLSFLRECLALDLKLEERCQRILKNSRTQYLILGFFSLFFAMVMKSYMRTSSPHGVAPEFVICLVQMGGVFLGDRVTRIYHKKFFSDVDEWFHGLLKLHAVTLAGGDLATLVPETVAPLMRRVSSDDLHELGRSLGDILERWRKWGGPLAPEIKGLLRFLHEIREMRFYQFERFLTLLNFILMALLFLGGHLLHLGALFASIT